MKQEKQDEVGGDEDGWKISSQNILYLCIYMEQYSWSSEMK